MKSKILLVTAVVFSSQMYAQQDSTKSLDELVVTATKSPIKQSQTGKVVTVIDQVTLQRSAGKTLGEILNYQAGLFVNGANNTLGTNPDNYLRGSASGNTLILVDGIPVLDPSYINSSFDLNSINPDQVEKIEILKGAQSTLWGSDAVAGVINIITKKGGDKKIGSTIGASYGSYQTWKSNVGVNGKLDKFTYNLNYNHTDSKGFSSAHDTTGTKNFDKDGFKQDNLQANLAYQLAPAFSISALSNYGKYNTDLDAGAFADDKDFTGTNTNFINSLSLVYKTAKTTLNFTNTLNNSRRTLSDDSSDVGGFSKYSRALYKGTSFVSELYGNFNLTNKLSLVAGVQRMALNTNQSYLSLSSFGPFETSLSDDLAKTTNYAAYASLLLLNVNGFNAEAGVRYNNHSIYGSNATYTFNPSYNIDDNTRVFVNISSAFKIPSLYQLYSEYGNKDLQPETSNNYEIGVQAFTNNKKNSLRIVGFKRDIRQLIVFYTDMATFDSKYINRDKQNDYGFEVESNIAIGNIGNWVNNVAYVDGEGIAENVKMKNFYRRPNFTFSSMLSLQPVKALTLMPSFRFVGSRLKAQYDAGPASMPQYYTLDFYAGYQLTQQWRAFVDVRNITDQKYFDIIGYNSRQSNFTVGVSAAF
ncbi:MAG: TonB-dependent receptor [Bacteroidota bacterium]|nr:TonB-dependent receptor [Ferruginibacter sp.]